MSRKPRDEGDNESTCPVWMMTFGDCMSLLVTFFVMLIAFSNMAQEKLMDMLGSMKGALGMVEEIQAAPSTRMVNYRDTLGLDDARQYLSLEALSALLPIAQRTVREIGHTTSGSIDKRALVRMIGEGLAFVIHSEVFFAEGSAELLPGNEELLKQIGHFSGSLDNEIRIIGVVDGNTRVATEHSSTPRGLGIERAKAFQEALSAESGLTVDRFGIGSRISSEGRSQVSASGADIEMVETIIVGYRRHESISPEEIVITDRWR